MRRGGENGVGAFDQFQQPFTVWHARFVYVGEDGIAFQFGNGQGLLELVHDDS